MFVYAKVVDEKTKLCEVGLGNEKTPVREDTVVLNDGKNTITNKVVTVGDLYKSFGMTKQSVEKSWDGKYYLKGFAPQKSNEDIAKEKRELRNQYLEETDKYMISDFPIDSNKKFLYKNYREYLRNLPDNPLFPEVPVLSFEEWNKKNNQ